MTARFILLALASCCALVVLAQKPAEVRPDSISTSKSWTPREPLSPEEQERRAAKEAELEAMRARFRRYQRSATAKTAADSITRAQGDYLWSDAETPRTEAAAIDTIRPLEPQRMDAEALRREIGRNLQVKGALNTPSVDEPPAAYDSPSFRLPQSDWESKWQVDKKRTPPAATNNTDWARDLGQEEPIAQKTGDYRAGGIFPVEVNFMEDGVRLQDGPQPALDEWLRILAAQPSLQLEIRAHAHHTLSTAAADTRSGQRAEAVRNYFIERGVVPERVRAHAYGKRMPLTFDRSEEGRRQNERLEVIVLQQ